MHLTRLEKMKKSHLIIALTTVTALSITSSSCIGSFALSKKIKRWNEHVGGKFVNELVFFAFWVFPVYPISYIADLLVINSIEFWSGSNPVSEQTTIVDGKEAQYKVERDAQGYTITNLSDKKKLRFNFDADNNSWSINHEGKEIKFMEFVDDYHVKMLTANGDFQTVELSQEGVFAYKQQVAANVMFANK